MHGSRYAMAAWTRVAVARGCIAAALALGAGLVHAVEAVTLDGALVQGGLVVGRTEPGARVEFGGRAIRVSPDGLFAIGFGRDEPARARLVVTRRDGARVVRELRIEPRRYDVQRIDGLPPRKVEPSPSDLARIRRESALVRAARERDDARTDFAGGFEWPLHGRISGVYGSQRILNGEPRRPHFGVDVAAPVGTVANAPADGVVTLVHPDMFFSGGTLVIDHGHGVSSTFIHLSRILVAVGDTVRRGEPVAEVGATGRATGPHLDWRMNVFERRVDPALLVGPMPAR